MMKYLRSRYPDMQLHALVFQRNREVLDQLEIIDKENILTIRVDSTRNFLSDSVKAVQTLRTIKVDAVIDCELFARISSLFSFLSGSPTKAGFHSYTQEGLYRGNFLNAPVPYNPYLHISKQFLNLAYALENNTIPNAKHPIPSELLEVPEKRFTAAEIEEFTFKLWEQFPRIQGRRLVLIYPSAGALPVRAWPIEYYCQLCNALIDDQLSVGIIGLDSDWHLGQQVADFTNSEYCFNLTGYTRTKWELLLLLQYADLLVTNDGGPGHLSAIVDTPSIIFFGPETPQLYRPLSSNAYCFYERLACSPCLTAYNHRKTPCDGDNQCLKRISVHQVLDKAREVLA
jgi:ADP-heptose:LPS heptosyltransferase